ncbi:MAG: hypothetical protein Q9191_000148 [Dirinaria sp. TL-2023a]
MFLPFQSRLLINRSDTPTGSEIHSQWHSPSDILSLLMIIGGDIVQKTLAQQSGRWFTPVCFSFGWVAYSFTTLLALVGDGRLMPEPDYGCKVFNVKTGYARENRSWTLGRVLRDNEGPLRDDEALCVTIYDAETPSDGTDKPAKMSMGKSAVFGTAIMAVQFGIAAIPLGLYLDWGVFVVTGVGTLLALLTGGLPQWKVEKFACRKASRKIIALTQGNGSRHVMIIKGNGVGLDLEDLAGGEGPRVSRSWNEFGLFVRTVFRDGRPVMVDSRGKVVENGGSPKREAKLFWNLPLDFWLTRLGCVLLSCCWMALLITVSGLEQNSWYLIAVGAIGMLQNVYVAGVPRKPEARGLYLRRHSERITGTKVMDVLMDLEMIVEKAGACLLDEFLPGFRTENEKAWWSGDREAYDAQRITEADSKIRGTPYHRK